MDDDRAEWAAAQAEAAERFEAEAGPPEPWRLVEDLIFEHEVQGSPGYEDEWGPGWEPYDDRPELAASRATAALGGRGDVRRVVRLPIYDDPRRPAVVDGATVAAMILAAVPGLVLAGVVVSVLRRWRVVRR